MADHETVEWARSGAMALTGRADGPPLLTTGAPASAVRAALDVIAAHGETNIPGVEILGERAAVTGFTRRAPWSAGGAFRAFQTKDGWLGMSLPRPSDLELVSALVGADASAHPWEAAALWLQQHTTEDAAARTSLLGLPASAIPPVPLAPRRPGVVITPGGKRRHHAAEPLVVDLSALWAGPLCAHLLGLTGARVVKVESVARPDGARHGPAAFYNLMHAGHESVALDFGTQCHTLRRLLSRADVVIEASRPRALRQLGIDSSTYVKRGAVWVSITAYGRSATDEFRVGFGDDVAAAAGLVVWEGGVPFPVGDAIADPLAGVTAAAAATVALTQTDGAMLDVSMYDVAVAAAGPPPDEPGHVAYVKGMWVVEASGRTVPVASPRARLSHKAPASFGAHTNRILAEIAS